MKDKWKTWLEEKGLSKWFQRDNLLILVLAGILLFVIAIPIEKSDEEGQDVKDLNGQNANNQSTSSWYNMFADSESSKLSEKATGAVTGTELSEENYVMQVEERLEEILAGMDGVGKVQVMVTLSASSEYVVEKDSVYNRSQTNETDSEGGSRIITQVDEQQTTVYNSEGSDQKPYIVKTLLPTVEGVVVVAEGAGVGETNKNITEVVQALFDVEAHKIKVVKMSKTN